MRNGSIAVAGAQVSSTPSPGTCRHGRRCGGLQLYQLRAAWGATEQLSGTWLRLWLSASGGAAQSAPLSSYFPLFGGKGADLTPP